MKLSPEKTKEVFKHVRRAGFVICLYCLFVYTVYFILFDRLPPGELFRPPLAVLIPLASAPVVLSCAWALFRIPRKTESHRTGRFFGQKDVRGLLILLAIIATTGATAVTGYSLLSRASEKKILDSARQRFRLEVHGSVSQKQAESTLVELERAIASLRAQYGVSSEEVIELYLYPDAEAIEKNTGRKAAGLVTFDSGSPIVHVSVEPMRNVLLAASRSSIPRHEALHIVLAEVLGAQRIREVPLWFHEGLARHEGLKDWRSTVQRTHLRLELFFGVVALSPAQTLLSQNQEAEKVDSSFQLSAFELVRYILKTRGADVPVKIVNEIKRGVGFEQAFKTVCGIDSLHMYEEWVTKFF